MEREELIALVSKAHLDSSVSYADAQAAGKAMVEASKLPALVAQNLGNGFGEWPFFPDVADVVDFALTYRPPTTEEELMSLARVWAEDEAQKKTTLMRLVGKEILLEELRRIDVPKLRELLKTRGEPQARALRKELGLAVREGGGATAEKPKRAPRAPAPAATATDGPVRMPKPKFVKPPPKALPAAVRRFSHPKFGEGTLEKSEGTGDDMKLTVKFEAGTKTLLAKFLTEIGPAPS